MESVYQEEGHLREAVQRDLESAVFVSYFVLSQCLVFMEKKDKIQTSTSNLFLCAADSFLQLGSCKEAAVNETTLGGRLW